MKNDIFIIFGFELEEKFTDLFQMYIDMGERIAGKQDRSIYEKLVFNCFPCCTYVSTVMRPAFADILVPRCPWILCKGLTEPPKNKK